MHFYVFSFRNGWEFPSFERTCGTLNTALAWATDYQGGVVYVNCLPARYFY